MRSEPEITCPHRGHMCVDVKKVGRIPDRRGGGYMGGSPAAAIHLAVRHRTVADNELRGEENLTIRRNVRDQFTVE